jgi:tRNA pseudouridine32 synthase/23S rRNA pseudouridine746 synthase
MLDFIYCDDFLLVANKPAELLAVPGRGSNGSDSLTSRVQQVYPDALCVHRLDMSTSGLLILARGHEMHKRLSQMFRERMVKKCYVAIVAGRVAPDQGAVELALSADWPNRPRQKVDLVNGKCSLTRYRVVAYDAADHTSRVELEPVTGRTHQLRVHMAALGHPIIGDRLYGGDNSPAANRLMLHARSLSFTHPSSSMQLTLSSEAPF